MSIYDVQRLHFTVIAWDGDKGVIVDEQRQSYRVTLEQLAPECQGCLFIGETVEALLLDWDRVTDVRGTSALPRERPTNESVGASGGARGRTPQTGSSKHNSGARAQ